jgi:putative endonuclease
MAWFLYMIECSDGSLYTGIALDVKVRYAQHSGGKGAKYTRSHPPKRLVFQKKFRDRSAASKAEYAMKQLTRAEKLVLIDRKKAAAKKKRSGP